MLTCPCGWLCPARQGLKPSLAHPAAQVWAPACIKIQELLHYCNKHRIQSLSLFWWSWGGKSVCLGQPKVVAARYPAQTGPCRRCCLPVPCDALSSQHCSRHCFGWGWKEMYIRLLFHTSAVHAQPNSTTQAPFNPLPAQPEWIAYVLRVKRHHWICVSSCPLMIFHNWGFVSLLRSLAGNFTSLNSCYCKDLWPSAYLWVLLLFSYSIAQL